MKRMIVAILLISQLVACGGGGSHVDKTPVIEAGKLNGDINSNAQATVVQITPVAVGQNDIVDDAILTRLDVVLDPEATVGQVNTALDKLGAKIVSSRDTSLFLTISVPRQSDFSSLADLAKQLTAMPGIAFAIPGQQGSNRIYPHYADAFPSISPNMTNNHLQNARLTTAWNAGGKLLDSCLNNPVSLLIVDKFGSLASLDSAMVDNINREFPSYTLAGSVLDDGETHGWDVAAIAAADFSPSNQTGAMPFSGCVNLTLLSVSGLTFQQQLDVIDTALRLNGGEKTIVNYSLGFKDRCDGTCTAESIADGSSRADFRQITPSYTRVLLAMSWRDMSYDLWNDFIITTAGGDEINEPTSNIYLNLGIMNFNSPINLASTGGTDLASGAKNWGDGTGTQPGFDLIGTDDVIYQILQNVAAAIPNKDQIENNVIMVGNADTVSASSFNTDLGFDAVYALGEDLLNLAGTDTVSGTSLSAPQVAGLAAYLWALDPSLKDRPMADTMHAILDNTRKPDNGADLAMLDAYAATLSLDKDTAASPPDAPIRGSILDVNDDGFFNQDDLTEFVNVYGLTTAPNPRTELIYFSDYDRFDLNGNWLFLKETGRFDLDPENSTYLGAANYSTVNLKIGTTDIPLDENNLTKTQILCYYAYSPLYLGDEASRDSLLPVDVCGGVSKPDVPAGMLVADVPFADANLKACALNSGVLTVDATYTLFCPNASVTNLSGIEYLTVLESLHLRGNLISDISPLKTLDTLTDLDLKGNQISDISPISNIVSLFQLDLTSNQIVDVSPTQNLIHVNQLSLSNNKIVTGVDRIGYDPTDCTSSTGHHLYIGANPSMSCNDLSNLIDTYRDSTGGTCVYPDSPQPQDTVTFGGEILPQNCTAP